MAMAKPWSGQLSDAFSFMFAFYGLVLGLALAEIAAGFSRAYDERNIRRIGVVAPLFGLLLLIDLITFWTNAWAYRDLSEVKFIAALGIAAVSLLYYFASTQVFPKATEKQDLDDHIMQSRRVVVFCVIVANLITQIPPLYLAIATQQSLIETVVWAALNLTYYGLLSITALTTSKRTVAIALAATITFVVGATIIFSYFLG